MINRGIYNKKEIGVFSGSFNPIHNGHLMLANYICEFTGLDEVWMVVTPQNPLKKSISLLEDEKRLKMVQMALKNYKKIKASDIEFQMPRPSYTINTLTRLAKDNPNKNFSLIIGADNWMLFNKWKNYETILNRFKVLVYPRLNADLSIPEFLKKQVNLVNAPIIDVSSTFIRKGIAEGLNMRAFVPEMVYDYIEENQLYYSINR